MDYEAIFTSIDVYNKFGKMCVGWCLFFLLQIFHVEGIGFYLNYFKSHLMLS